MTSYISCTHSYPSGHQRQTCPLITLICARACNTHLRWGFSSYILSAMNSCHDRGRCLLFNNALNHHFGNGNCSPFTSGIEKNIFWVALTNPSVSVKTARALMSPPSLDTSGCFKQMALYPLRGMNCRDTRFCQPRVLAVCHDFIQILQSLQHVFNIFLKARYHISWKQIKYVSINI